jgi:hypothetical protein
MDLDPVLDLVPDPDSVPDLVPDSNPDMFSDPAPDMVLHPVLGLFQNDEVHNTDFNKRSNSE